MLDLADWSQSVSIDAASVTIPVSGSVSITSGSVTIANASIAVINATGTTISTIRAQLDLGQAPASGTHSNPNTTRISIPPSVTAIALLLVNQSPANFAHIQAIGNQVSGVTYFEVFVATQQVYVFPVASAFDVSLDFVLKSANASQVAVEVIGLTQPEPTWLEFFAPPQAEPNQFPKTVLLTLAALTAQWVIQSVANVQITLFNIVVMRFNPSVANDDFQLGYSAALPANGSSPPNAEILIDSTQTAASGAGPMFTLPLAGVQLPRGDGLWADISLSAIANLWLLVEYSLS